MEPDRYLIATAQISLAIAGFAGIVAAYRNESVHKWGDVERFWLRLLLLNSILPFTFSLVGIFVLAADPLPVAKWRWLSGFAALTLIPYAGMIVRNLAGFTAQQLRAAGGGRVMSYTLFVLLAAICILQLWNVATSGAFWPFFGAILLLLLGAMYQFVRLVLKPKRPDRPETATEEES